MNKKFLSAILFVAPTVADQFAIRTGYVKDDAINAYFYFTDKATVAANKVVELTKYFSKFDKVAGVELGETKVGETNKKSSELAILVGDDKFETTTLQLDPAKKPNSQFEYGYGETLNVPIAIFYFNRVAIFSSFSCFPFVAILTIYDGVSFTIFKGYSKATISRSQASNPVTIAYLCLQSCNLRLQIIQRIVDLIDVIIIVFTRYKRSCRRNHQGSEQDCT
jgi:hypothetical protein